MNNFYFDVMNDFFGKGCIFQNTCLDLPIDKRRSIRKDAEKLNLNSLTIFDTVKHSSVHHRFKI